MQDSLLSAAAAYSKDWKNRVVQPLRDIRTNMKQQTALAEQMSEYESFREQVKQLELDAERKQQEQLQEIADDSQHEAIQGNEEPFNNLIALCAVYDISPDAAIKKHFNSLIDAAAPLNA